jgi:alpha/beta superfamily hydrolase
MQLLMRRPEIAGFVSVAPPANMFDFTFLAPCPSSGLVVLGSADEIVTQEAVQKLVDKLSSQRDIDIEYKVVAGANHFFQNKIEDLDRQVDRYLAAQLKKAAAAQVG